MHAQMIYNWYHILRPGGNVRRTDRTRGGVLPDRDWGIQYGGLHSGFFPLVWPEWPESGQSYSWLIVRV